MSITAAPSFTISAVIRPGIPGGTNTNIQVLKQTAIDSSKFIYIYFSLQHIVAITKVIRALI